MSKSVFVIAGPGGSGKDSIIRGLIARHPKIVFGLNATTRPPRTGERDGVNYHFLSEEEFLKKRDAGEIPEYYYRESTKSYYGLYKTEIDAEVAKGNIVALQVQIVGARYAKEVYGATCIFIMPTMDSSFEERMLKRSAMGAVEFEERMRHTKREIEVDAPWYDYRVHNEDGKLEAAIDEVESILKLEGYDIY